MRVGQPVSGEERGEDQDCGCVRNSLRRSLAGVLCSSRGHREPLREGWRGVWTKEMMPQESGEQSAGRGRDGPRGQEPKTRM